MKLKMLLTKKQALIEHRKLWNWLADESLKQKRKVIKEEYFTEFSDDYDDIPISNCWCCEYAKASCKKCPIRWDGTNQTRCRNLSSPYRKWLGTPNNDYEMAAKLARKIANLPERKDRRRSK